MDVTFPDLPGLSGAFLLGHRRRPGSPVSGDNIEQVISIIVKRAYTIAASATDPTAGSLTPREDGPEIFEGDQPGAFLDNADFADGLDGWSETGGAEATVGDENVTILRNGALGDLRRNAGFGRTLRDRDVGFSVDATGTEGLTLPELRVVASGQTVLADDPGLGTPFPAADKQPVTISGFAEFSSAVTASTASFRMGTMGADGQSVTYAAPSAASIEYESDMVPFKPEADLIVIADADPVPVAIAVDGTTRMSQEALAIRPLTGLGWERRFGTIRETDGGVFDPPPPQPLPDAFENRYYNGYRRDRRQGATVPYPADGAEIVVTDADADIYAFTLTTGGPRAVHAWFTGTGQDDPCLWRKRDIVFNLDTLVIEPDRDHAYAVWRAAWPVDFDPDGTGTVPLDNNRSVTVTWEGG
ncbi:hypothetical protein RGUI_3683 [Rhodovulum sp. P5]|uniref:hypothetical protein n=1 Tax=Rhodovulum sp. P5 TaxID=1564506 RepID=UPI0009C3804C|nr:hypothetical protein [Rhodovulum sp. P5]ARE41824.1 hypothetical protein RGUI_3683 [Rhodovulum sp. P5]